MTNELQTFDVAGVTLHALVRGHERGPVVLVAQAGPGFPLLHEASALERALELEATHRVVYLDPRGAGRSLDPGTAALTVEQLTADVVAVAEACCERLGVPSLALLGFSLGGSVAMLASRVSTRIRQVIAVGPDVDFAHSERVAWEFARDEAIRRGHHRALRQLRAIGAPPHHTAEAFMTRVRWVTDFGGIHVGRSFAGLLLSLLARLFSSRHYSLAQAVAALRAMGTTQARALPSLAHFRLPDRVEVPLTVIQGRLDIAAPAAVLAPWFETLDAPRGKRLLWLDDCAHTPHFERPVEFRRLLHQALGAS